MGKKKICFIAQFPPPIHGLSKAVDTLYQSSLSSAVDASGQFEFEKINLTNNKNFIKNLGLIFRSKADLFYFTISQSKGGNLRDLLILKQISLKKKKCLIHLHGGYYRYLLDNDMNSWQRRENYKAISKLDGAIVLSNSLRSIFKGMLPDEKIHVVMNGVDDEFFPSDIEIESKLKVLEYKGILRFLYLSNFIRTKGYPEVLKMAKLEKKRVEEGGKKRFQFEFAGKFYKKSERLFFEHYIKNNGIENYVTYHGIVNGQEKQRLLSICDLFILPTRYPNEGQPISILEAMANAMIIVTTDHAGIPDIVENNVNGIVASKGMKIDTVYRQLLRMCNRQVAEIGRLNREYCKSQFTQKRYVESMERVVTNILLEKSCRDE